MKIVSLNTCHGQQQAGLRHLLASYIDSTDVFCFQEADGELVDTIFRDTFSGEPFHEITSTKTTSNNTDTLKVFVRKGIEVIASDTLLADTGDEAGCCNVVTLRYHGQTVIVASIHGAPYPGDKCDTPGRIMQSKAIIDALADRDGIKVVCGDFNLQPDTESVAVFKQAGYANLIADYNIETTRNDFGWRRYPDNVQLFADYAFVAPGVAVRHFAVPYSLAADHLPLLIDIDLSYSANMLDIENAGDSPVYITGNKHKAKFLAKLLGIDIDYRRLSLAEIQSPDPREVIEHKVRQAYKLLRRPVLVEDTCMGLDELDGLPGTFIKFFIEQENGDEKICRMADGLPSRRATATVTFGYYDGERLRFFQGSIHGDIPQHPGRPISGFGWDTVFVPDGYSGQIRSELSQQEYDTSYLELKPIAAVREFFATRH